MPELPEVNAVMKVFRTKVLNKTIVQVEVHDDHILRNCSADEFIHRLLGHKFVDTYRQGKYFFAHLDHGHDVLFHLGMTGDPEYYQSGEEPPRHERFNLHFSHDIIMGYNDPRKFSRIHYLEDRDQYIHDLGLGPDALKVTWKKFQQIMNGKKGQLKALLLDQSLLAGVGNLYADEICYQARLHPASKLDKLSPEELKTVYQCLHDILQKAVDLEAYYKVYPADWFWTWREKNKTGPNGESVKTIKVGGRTTYYVEGWQKWVK